jgi:hypothetical protein
VAQWLAHLTSARKSWVRFPTQHPQIETYAALDEQPSCRVSSEYSDDQFQGRENTKKIIIKKYKKIKIVTSGGLVSSGGLGSSGGSLIAPPDCKPAVPSSYPAISTAYNGLPILGWSAICRLSSEGRQRRINTKKGPLVHQKLLRIVLNVTFAQESSQYRVCGSRKIRVIFGGKLLETIG